MIVTSIAPSGASARSLQHAEIAERKHRNFRVGDRAHRLLGAREARLGEVDGRGGVTTRLPA